MDKSSQRIDLNPSDDELDAYFLDALRHHKRLDFDNLGAVTDDEDGILSCSTPRTYKTLIRMINQSDILARQYIIMALFERSLLAPLQLFDESGAVSCNLLNAISLARQKGMDVTEDTKK